MTKTLLRSIGLFGAGVMVATLAPAIGAVDVGTYKELDQFMSVFERVRSDYVDKVDDRTLIKGAIDGMLASLDPHSSYLDARDRQNMRTQTQGAYGGLGLSVTMEDGAVKIMTAQEDTPAAKAGLKTGDFITHLDGKLLYGGTLDEAVDQMRGKPGTKILITVVRPGRDKPFDVSLTRELIQLKPVKWEVKDQVGIININTFVNANTGDSVRAAIAGIQKSLGHDPLGYVIDLRSNPGGLLDQAIDVSDIFLDRGEIVSQRGREKNDIERRYATASPPDLAHGLPMIVLVDAGSASAAEIVAGALQDQKRALVMGERTFGKGSVQTVLELSDDTALKLTTARYYTPSGKSVQEGGIKPDILVPQLSDPDYKDRPRLREADLRRHLINEAKIDDKVLEDDGKPDPRFQLTSEALKKQGIDDFQLDYAVKTIARMAQPPLRTALAGARSGAR
ncbi:PDZ domain-containing protein [Sphingomonas histidinilytica]|uniref:Carboxyl-terminal processing protease n=1 Tax=Rhizorhabdus histidinilytica TaxID=439228 RepID=A0A1T5E1V3_9SPHN|nr:PDZ domain-containing protein [Rhizorhabdus histidinilytica]QEH80706.1 S41 family peptidase [Sphingomonas sp. C8-2]SKB78102.1 carboxyl-terminal processing protease [Rhizorhabdus histidinilytica]